MGVAFVLLSFPPLPTGGFWLCVCGGDDGLLFFLPTHLPTHPTHPPTSFDRTLTFFNNPALVDWVVASLYYLWRGGGEGGGVGRAPRPLFRQLFEAESSTYTYLLADPECE